MGDFVKGTVLAVGLACFLNLVIYGLGRALDVSFLTQQPNSTTYAPVSLAAVIGLSVATAVIAAGGLALLNRLTDRAPATFGWLVGLVGLLSLLGPYSLAHDSGSYVALGLMHIASTIAILYGLANTFQPSAK